VGSLTVSGKPEKENTIKIDSILLDLGGNRYTIRKQLHVENEEIRPVYTSRKIKDTIEVKQQKPSIVNQQSAVYYFKCDLCDVDYVGYSCRHLHQRIEEHKGSAIGRHIKEQRGKQPDNIEKNFKILRKCQSKLDCLIFEMLFIRLLKPKLNKQTDSLRAKLFV